MRLFKNHWRKLAAALLFGVSFAVVAASMEPRPRVTLASPHCFLTAKFSADGKTIVTSTLIAQSKEEGYHDNDGWIQVWDVESGREKGRFWVDSVSDSSPSLSPDARYLAFQDGYGHGRRLFIVDLRIASAVASIPMDAAEGDEFSDYNFSPDGNTLAITRSVFMRKKKRALILWDVLTKTERATLDLDYAYCFSPDSSTVASVIYKHGDSYPLQTEVVLWDARTGRSSAVLRGPKSHPYGFAFSEDGSRIVWACRRNEDFVWRNEKITELECVDLTTGRTAWKVETIAGVGFNSTNEGWGDCRTLFRAEHDSIRVWDIRTGREWGPFSNPLGSQGATTSTIPFLSPDGKLLLVANLTTIENNPWWDWLLGVVGLQPAKGRQIYSVALHELV